MRDTIDMAREVESEVGFQWCVNFIELARFEALVRADERMSFYGQDKPAECADGCPPNQICDYCQVVAPAKAMILAEREACAKVCLTEWSTLGQMEAGEAFARAIRNRGNT